MVSKDRARGGDREEMMLMTKSTCKSSPALSGAPVISWVSCRRARGAGGGWEGLVSWRLAAPLAWKGRDWFVTRGPSDWARSPSDLSLSLPPYLCCPLSLLHTGRLAQQLGKGAQLGLTHSKRVEGHGCWNSVRTGRGHPALPTSHFLSCLWNSRGSQSPQYTSTQIHQHSIPQAETQPKALCASLLPSASVSLAHTHTHTHAHTRSVSPPLPPSCYLWLAETSRSTNINYKGQRKVRRRQLSKGVVMLFQVNCKCVRGKISPQWFLSAWLMGTGADSLPELLQLCLKPHTFQQEPSAWAFLNSLFISFIKGIRQVGICMKRILWEYCLQGRYFHDFPHPGALCISSLSLSLLLDGALKEAALIFHLIWGKEIFWAAYIEWQNILYFLWSGNY